MSPKVLDIVESLLELDPVRSYPDRGAKLVAHLVRASAYRLSFASEREQVLSEPPPSAASGAALVLPLKHGSKLIGTLYLHLGDRDHPLGRDELRVVRSGARLFARGLTYAARLTVESSRRPGESVLEVLTRAPLTPRERDVAALVAAGASTQEISEQTSLAAATINTYLKRIFAKFGVHSRVELVATIAGTSMHRRSDAAKRSIVTASSQSAP